MALRNRMPKKRSKVFTNCDRCEQKLNKSKRLNLRYVFIQRSRFSNSVNDNIYSKLLCFCDMCLKIFDEINYKMRESYLYEDNQRLIKFYEQYGKKHRGWLHDEEKRYD